MRSASVIFLFFVLSFAVSAQSRQQQKVDSVFVLVKKYINLKNADAVYNIAGSEAQKQISINALNDFFTRQIFPLGQIKESSLISFVNNSTANYKLNFDSVILQLVMNLDNEDKLQMFFFQPYAKPAGNKTSLVPTSNPLKSETDKKVDTVARVYIQKANTVGLCIGIMNGGKVTVYGYGTTVKGQPRLPNADNFFELGSITKTFTATLLAYYVNEGKVKLNDPITEYLPDSVASNPQLRAITLLDLSNHTSSLPSIPADLLSRAGDPLNPYKDFTKQRLYAWLRSCKLNNTPGEHYEYSNMAVGLLGSILEGISGKPFEQMVTGIICKPLGMLSTNQYLNPLLSPRFVNVYNISGDPTPTWDFDVLAPCGALRSTMNDLLIYAKANLNPGTDKLSKAIALTHQITFTKDVKIGLAWHVIIVNNVNYYFHNGGTYGSSSFLAFNPEKNIAVVVLSNAAESTDTIGVDILKKIQ